MNRTTISTLALALLLAGTGLTAPVAAQEGHDHHQHHQHQAPPAQDTETRAEAVSHLNIPDVNVMDQDGKPVQFYSDLVKDRVVAVNFVFTTCTTICPPMGANFAKLQKILGDRTGRDVHLISVSVDPTTDTPERMKAWGRKFGAGPGWTLVTGSKEEVTRLLKALGVYTADINDHSPLVLVGNDARHQWTRAYGLAAPAKIAELIDGMAAPAKDSK
ncbi:MAG TPA: SCO family protein [Thermoanaerobaculia bacterium]|nr:SCO family protein [Thermoanaerobaculia bacterium]